MKRLVTGDRRRGRGDGPESLSAGVPRPLVETAKLGRTLSKRAR